MRLTLCNFLVDETNDEQKASHKLREAPICGRCEARARHDGGETEYAFTQGGRRRHYTRPIT